uniref:DUF7240 domain-containing protein n=1 Tax=Nocardia farcinica TaxID=37329 RepID=UPI001E5C4F14|nr:hypothetical protein [Nocardia farcinica]UEX21238.1 hypothetical protein LMJ57_19755 [Nocardia farcinica]
MRGRLILAGIPDPLRMLPDMHAVLDVVEVMLTEHADAKALERLKQILYRPDLEDDTPPPGFEVEEQQQSFKAFAAFAGE